MVRLKQLRATLGKCEVVVSVIPGALKVNKTYLPLQNIRSVHVNGDNQLVITITLPVINDLVLEGTPEDCEKLYTELYQVCHENYWSVMSGN